VSIKETEKQVEPASVDIAPKKKRKYKKRKATSRIDSAVIYVPSLEEKVLGFVCRVIRKLLRFFNKELKAVRKNKL